MRLLPLLLLLLPAGAFAHGGGLDDRGGHRNSQTGRYHCHQPGCTADTEGANATTDADYDRDAWPHWSDTDGDCRDTRAEVLIRTSKVAVSYRRTERCVVASGLWIDPYTGQAFRDASRLDIDHLVPLSHAHSHGGAQWSHRQRADFANDPANLIPVSASANRSKGGDAPNEWLPDNQAYRCEYGRRWQRITAEYELRSAPEAVPVLERLLQSCHQGRVTRR